MTNMILASTLNKLAVDPVWQKLLFWFNLINFCFVRELRRAPLGRTYNLLVDANGQDKLMTSNFEVLLQVRGGRGFPSKKIAKSSTKVYWTIELVN